MNYGFDLDETITAEPDAFRSLMAALMASGHGVYIITGIMPSLPNAKTRTHEALTERLSTLGFELGKQYTELRLASADGARRIATLKRDICAELDLTLMFEDRSDYAEEIRHTCRVVMMWPR